MIFFHHIGDTMYVKFATTSGDVFNDTPLNVGEHPLGEVLTYDDGIVIVDRIPGQLVSQLNINEILILLRKILQKLYTLQVGNIEIYLPRMFLNINAQAKCQAKFQTLSSIFEYNCTKQLENDNIFNIQIKFI